MSGNTLIISAWWPEIRALLVALGGNEVRRTVEHPFPLTSLEEQKISEWRKVLNITLSFVLTETAGVSLVTFPTLKTTFSICGIGSVTAAANVATLLAQYPDFQKVVFTGTAGIFPPAVAENQLLLCHEVIWTDHGLLSHSAYLPAPAMKELRIESTPSLLPSPLAELKKGVCVSVPSITKESSVAARMSALGNLENLELFGVAKAAQINNKEWLSVLGVTNTVGSEAHHQWFERHISVSLQLQNLVHAIFSEFISSSASANSDSVS